MVRTCVVCRAPGPAEERVRLALIEGELQLAPNKAPGQRGLWLCARRACIDGLSPKTVGRALKGPGRLRPGLIDSLRALRRRDVEQQLQRCWASGLCDDGQKAALAALQPAFFLLACDASALLPLPTSSPRWTLHLDRGQLGQLLGRGPRSIVAVRPGRPARSLVRVLQCLSWLG